MKTVVLTRDPARRAWVERTSAGWLSTPWADDADAVAVALWAKLREDGQADVKFVESMEATG